MRKRIMIKTVILAVLLAITQAGIAYGAGEALSLNVTPALGGGTSVATVGIVNPADVEFFSIEVNFTSGTLLSLPNANWFSRGTYYPSQTLTWTTITSEYNQYSASASLNRKKVYINGFKPSGTSGSIGSVTLNVAGNAQVNDYQVVTVSGSYYSKNEQGVKSFQPVTAQFTVSQPPACTYTVQPNSYMFGPAGGTRSFNVLTGANCAWTVLNNTGGWATVTSASSGTGNATVTFTVQSNAGSARSGTLTVGGQAVTIQQNTVTAPALFIDPAQVNYGTVYVGSTTPQAVKIQNTGSSDAVISGITVTGTDALMFTVDKGTCSSLTPTIAAGSSCSVNVGFKPTSAGAKSGSLRIASNVATQNPLIIGLSGTAVSCISSVSPAQHVFSSSGGGGTITITALGGCQWTALADVTWIHITSGSSGTGSGAVNFTVDANANTAQRTGGITVSGETVSVTEGGTSASMITVTPNTLDFGTVQIGAPGMSVLTKNATIQNTGTANLVVSGMSITDGDAGMFDVAAGTCGSLTPTLAAGSSCTVQVTFEPTSVTPLDDKSAHLAIVSNAGNYDLLQVLLSGSAELCAKTFYDVAPAPGNAFEPFIRTIACRDITKGCDQSGSNFCPANNVTRAQMAVFILKSLGVSPAATCTGTAFNDVSASLGDATCRYIEKFATLGITKGCVADDPGTPGNEAKYCPNDVVTRGQMAVFILKALVEDPAATCMATVFKDVNASMTGGDIFCRYVEKFKTMNITAGCVADDPGTPANEAMYCPTLGVQRQAMAVFLTKAFLQ